MSDWPAVPIAEVVQVIGGGTPKKSEADYYGGDIPWVTPKDMKTSVISQAQIRITDEGLKQSASKIAPRNSVLIVVRSGVLKHTVPVAVNTVPVAINQDMKALICGSRIDAGYLARFIKARSSEVLSWVRATTADNFPIEKLSRLKIPLPDLAEQKRIAAVLDQVDSLRAKRREAIALLGDLTGSIFLDMFGDPASSGSRWDRKPIGELGTVVTGNTPSRACSENYGDGIEWIKTDNIRPPELHPGEAAERLSATGEKAGRVVPAESILVTCIAGSPASIGNSALAGRRVAINQQINALIPEGVLSRFMLEQIRVGKSLVQRKSTGAMTGLVNKSQFSSIQFMVPPMEKQREFVSRVERMDSVRTCNIRHLATLDELFTSLQHRAFSGTLWDHEEPGDAA
ncbi:restriction endonuclease subunit S [Streptomyces mirabilis]|uniref:restriction endonuclease subunit S n=1 Tax=Streptomyces mirabilis TaxID=68239 RepID=UPI00365E0000